MEGIGCLMKRASGWLISIFFDYGKFKGCEKLLDEGYHVELVGIGD